MKPEVSIIVPAYQVEKYISRCLDSFLDQTYEDFEVIIINDGSEDNTGFIAEEYRLCDKRFHLYHQENQGLSSARNTGLSHAKGKYIVFIDSDDFIEKEMLEKLIKLIKERDYDVIVPCINYYVSNVQQTKKKIDLFDFRSFRNNNPLEYIFEVLICQGRNWSVARGAMYRNDIIQAYKIKFPIGYIAEDIIFNLKYFSHVSKMGIYQEPYYNYLVREGSITHRHNPDFIKVVLFIDQEVFNFMESSGNINEYSLIARDSLLCRNVVIHIYKNIRSDLQQSSGLRCRVDQVRKLFDHVRVQEAFSQNKFIKPYWPSKSIIIFVIMMRALLKQRLFMPAILLNSLAHRLRRTNYIMEG